MVVEELLIQKKVPYIPKGRDYVVECFNPEHNDNNPSMHIDKITGIFHCLSCGYKGNVFSKFGAKSNPFQIRKELFKQKIQNKLSESIGLQMPLESIPYKGDWRDISSETYERFEAFQNASSEYVGRIVFPVRDISGIIVAFIGRHQTMTHNPKYLVQPANAKMPLFPMVKPILGKVILVEGIFDMLNLHDKGLTNAMCCFGTRTMNTDKLQILRMQGVEGVDIFFDGDEAGQTAYEKIREMCEQVGLSTRNVYMEDTDPGSLSATTIERLRKSLYG